MEELPVEGLLAHLAYLLSSTADARDNLHASFAECLLREIAADASFPSVATVAKTLNNLNLEEPRVDPSLLTRLLVATDQALNAPTLEDATAIKQLVKFKSALEKAGTAPEATTDVFKDLGELLAVRISSLGAGVANVNSSSATSRRLVVVSRSVRSSTRVNSKKKKVVENEDDDSEEEEEE